MATPSRSRPSSSSIEFTASDAASACLQEIDGCLWPLLSFPAFPAIALSLASVDRVAGKQVTVGLLQARPSPNKIHLCKERYNRPAQSGRASSNPYLIDSAEFWLRKPNKSPGTFVPSWFSPMQMPALSPLLAPSAPVYSQLFGIPERSQHHSSRLQHWTGCRTMFAPAAPPPRSGRPRHRSPLRPEDEINLTSGG